VRPFDVLADNERIRDIGTQFNVRRYADHVSVAVLAGAVEVFVSTDAAAHPLRQGQRLSHTSQGGFSAVESIDVATAIAWREGRLVFSGQPLGEVLAELGRYHAASLTVTSPRVMAIKVSGTFPTGDLRLALTTIAASLRLKLTQTGPQSWRLDA
jgi:transmembrane sensor